MNIDVIMLAFSKSDEIKKMTAEAIKSLHDSSGRHKFNVFVVETSREKISYEGATVILGTQPFNYNANLNIGLKRCTSDWIVISNNDVIFHADWADAILDLNAPSASPVCPEWSMHKDKIGKITYGYRSGIELAGWCIMAKRSTIDAIGGFDEQFDMFHQDDDYGFCLREKGLEHALVGTSMVRHLVAKTHDGYQSKSTKKLMKKSYEKLIKKHAKPASLCLTMIVKNESKVILEALESIYKHIHCWSIVDTGSTDDTKDKIRNFFKDKGIPGELYDRPWVNFGHNRTEALQLADGKADYMVMMDADDILHGTPDFSKMIGDCYSVRHGGNFSYWRTQIFRSGMKWRYVGVLHEYPTSDIAKSTCQLLGDYDWVSRTVGSRNDDPLKYSKDAQVLEEALKTEPNNSRYWFYLGQSYFDAKDFANARRAYAKRAEMGDWPEEAYYAQYRVGLCSIILGADDDIIISDMLKAFALRPSRAEAMYSLALHLRNKSQYAKAYPFALTAAQTPLPVQDSLFVHRLVYEYQAADELSISSFYTGRIHDCKRLCEQILPKKCVPDADRERIMKNLKSCESILSGGHNK